MFHTSFFIAEMTPGELYMLSFYWASSTGALVGLGDIVASPDNITEVRG